MMFEWLAPIVSLLGRLVSRKRVVNVNPVYNNCTVIILNDGPVILDRSQDEAGSLERDKEDTNGIEA